MITTDFSRILNSTKRARPCGIEAFLVIDPGLHHCN